MARERKPHRTYYRIPLLGQRNPDTYVALLEEWLRACDTNHHGECHAPPVSERPHYAIPDWVIDTEEGCIVPGHSVQEYVALSYTWESPRAFNKQPLARLVLDRTNLYDFQQPGYLRNNAIYRTPDIIRDSIELVRRSGTRYLWVDCICILQNDKTTRDRISRMNEVYSGALFTIIAAHDDSCRIYDTPCDGYNYTRNGQPNVLRLQGNLLKSNWASRGWTFQEHLLSRRCLIFIRDIVFWECQGDTWCPKAIGETDSDNESDPRSQFGTYHGYRNVNANAHGSRDDPSSSSSEEGKANDGLDTGVSTTCPVTFSFPEAPHPMVVAALAKNKTASQELLSARPIPDFALYIELVCRYTTRKFTYEQDVLAGFSGILNEFAHSFHGGFISGLPALFLDATLIWQPLLKAKRRTAVEDLQQHSSSSPLPSWSWAGWRCLLDPQSLDSGKSYSQDVETNDLWLTEKLVDWHTLSDDGLQRFIDEPSMLHTYKAFGATSSPDNLLPGWSQKTDFVPASKRDPSVMSWFVHDSLPEARYRHPLPLGNIAPGALSERNHARLTCITTKAVLTVRKELYAEGDNTLRPKILEWNPFTGVTLRHRMLRHSVLHTTQYDFDFEATKICPVVTLEDGQGRWAGTLRIMDCDTIIQPRAKLEMIAISTGSAPFLSAAKSYSEKIDATSTFIFAPGRTKIFHRRDPNVEWVRFGFKETFSSSSEAEGDQSFPSSGGEEDNLSESEETNDEGEEHSIPPHYAQRGTDQQGNNRDREDIHEETKPPRRWFGYLARQGQSREREDHVPIQSCPLRSRFTRRCSYSSDSDDNSLRSSGLAIKELLSCDGERKYTPDEHYSSHDCSDSDQDSRRARRGSSSPTQHRQFSDSEDSEYHMDRPHHHATLSFGDHSDGESAIFRNGDKGRSFHPHRGVSVTRTRVQDETSHLEALAEACETRRYLRNQRRSRYNSHLESDLFTVSVPSPDVVTLGYMASRNRRRNTRSRQTAELSVKIAKGGVRPIIPTDDTVQTGLDLKSDGHDDAFQREAIDQGPFYEYWRQSARRHEGSLPDEFKKSDPYIFYNVLWVETIDGVMYRRAAGRVLKEVWEANCGEPERIVLG